jgi:hypothetical protein
MPLLMDSPIEGILTSVAMICVGKVEKVGRFKGGKV